MDGQLNGNILRSSDGHVYHRYGEDGKNPKLYFKCAKYRRGGCRVIIQNNYTDNAMEHLRIFHKNGTHKHIPSHDSLKRAQRLSNINNNRSKIWQPTLA